jgi:hypothetical protein
VGNRVEREGRECGEQSREGGECGEQSREGGECGEQSRGREREVNVVNRVER